MRRALVLCLSAFLLVPFAALAAEKKPLLRPVNINTATAAELQRVPGIGPKTAAQILAMRRNVGSFRSVDDLLAVRGIGPKRLAKMKPFLTVQPPRPAPRKSAPAPLKKPAPAAQKAPSSAGKPASPGS